MLEEYPKYNQRLVVKFRCYCGEITEKRFEMLNLYRLPYCKECSLKKKAERCKNTCLEKYGVSNAGGIQESLEKMANTFQEKYGGHPKTTPEVQEKWKQTCLEKYGGYHNQNRDIQIKAEKIYSNSKNLLFQVEK